VALPNAARADGLSRPGAVGSLDRRYRQTWPHHQDRQPPRATYSGGVLVELSACTASGEEKAREGCGSTTGRARDRLKAQCRLSARYRALIRKGKPKNVAVTAIAREFAGFIWAVSREVAPAGLRPHSGNSMK